MPLRRPSRLLMTLLALALLGPALRLDAAKTRRHHARARKPAAAAQPAVDESALWDWRLQPFSDLASHGVLLHRAQGLLAWDLASAGAFGSLAAAPSPAKALVALRLDLLVEGEGQPRFAASAVSLSSRARWAEESADDGPLRAQAVTVFADCDLVVAAVNVKNISRKPLRVRPRLRLQRPGQGLRAELLQGDSQPELQLGLDRSALVGRPLAESVLLRLGGQSGRASLLGAGASLSPLEPGKAQTVEGKDLDLELTWPAPQLLAPGQTLRVPLLVAWGPDAAAVRKAAARHWTESALPVGKAWNLAQARWATTKRHLPESGGVHPALLLRACLDLLMAEYAPRAGLNVSQFSAQKGRRDAFFGVDSSLAALGWSELDMDRAEDSLLGLASFSAAAPAPVPPYTGEEKLAWDAAGLPLHAWAAWELYHRDPQAPRAGTFLAKFGERLRNECAWWPGARDGDGNGLYAFARDEEKPPYLQRRSPSLPALFNEPAALSPGAQASLQTWSLALSSLVAWQYQAASALADAAGAKDEAAKLLDLSQRSQAAILAQGWDPTGHRYREGLDGMWPFVLGLDNDPQHQQSALDDGWVPLMSSGERPWVEDGVLSPWRFYVLMRTLASHGYLALERELSERFLKEMEQRKVLDYDYAVTPAAQTLSGGSVATAAVVLELILQRQEQEVFLTEKTAEFEAPMVQFRSKDGLFYMKRNRLPEIRKKYADIKVETPKHGSILSENSFIFSCPETLALQIQSEKPMDIMDLNRGGALIFKHSTRVQLLVQPKVRIQVKFYPVESKN